MFHIRPEQLASLRRRAIADGLVDTFRDSPASAARDPLTDTVVVTDSKGNATRFAFDDHGFIESVTNPSGRTWRLRNTAEGRAEAVVSPNGHRLSIDYDAAGLTTGVRSDEFQRLRFDYTKDGQLRDVIFPDGSASSAAFDEQGRIKTLTSRSGSTERYEHNEDGLLTAVVDGNGHATRFQYGQWSRPDRVEFADGGYEEYQYDHQGSLKAIGLRGALASVDIKAESGSYTITYPDGEHVEIVKNERGQIVRAATADHVCEFNYDDKGRVTSERAGEFSVSYEYDDDGALVATVWPTGERITYEHDGDGRLSGVTDWTGGRHQFIYDDGDREYRVRTPADVEVVTSLNRRGMPEVVRGAHQRSPGADLFSWESEYDVEDRLITFADSDYGLHRLSYDADGQVSLVEHRRGTESFSYDAAGNRIAGLDGQLSYSAGDRIASAGQTTFQHDQAGNLTDVHSPAEHWRFRYSTRNLMIEAQRSGHIPVRFGYDALGRRIWKKSGDSQTRYCWAGETLIREERSEGDHITSQDYLFFPGGHTPCATRYRGQVYSYHNDHLGTPRRLTGPDGDVAWSAEYDVWGDAHVTRSAVRNPLRLPGHYFDDETELHYNRFRYYSPWLGRYLSRDPVGLLGGTNHYRYAGNDPVNVADPLGLGFWSTVGVIAASVAVGIAVVALAPVALPAAIILGGIAAGAVGFGLNEYLNQQSLCIPCILKEALRGALIGGIAALPFAFLPLTAGVAAFAGVGALSGFIGYSLDVATGPRLWSWRDCAIAVGIGAATAGLGRYFAPRIGAWWRSPKAPQRGLPPEGLLPPVENPSTLKAGPASRPSEAARGGRSLWDKNGGEWRYYPEDKWHNPHWDYNPHDSFNSPWQNVPISDKPPRKM